MTTNDIIAAWEARNAAQDAMLQADKAKEVTVDVIFWDRHGDMITASVTGIAPFEVRATVGGLTGTPGFAALGQPYLGFFNQRRTFYRNVKRNGERELSMPLLTEAEATDLAAALNTRVKIAADEAATDAAIAESAVRLSDIRAPIMQAAE